MVYSDDPQTQYLQDQSVLPQQNNVESSLQRKPIVIGIYGVSGCGKSFLLKQLEQKLGTIRFTFYDGSAVISEIVPGGLEAFRKLPEIEKISWRKAAIEKITKDSFVNQKIAIVSGHFMFWSEVNEKTHVVCNENDLNTYTHIIYLDTPPNTIHDRRARDVRKRSECSLEHLHKWQDEEKNELRKACYDHFILFSVLQDGPDLLDKVCLLLKYFEEGTEVKNRNQAEQELYQILAEDVTHLKTVLIIDGDKTLCAHDTSIKFWEIAAKDGKLDNPVCPLKQLFGSKLGYSYSAFQQAMLLYEENFSCANFEILCEKVASETIIHADFLSLLHLIRRQKHTRAVVVTCGIRQVWEKILRRAGLLDKIPVIGGSRIQDGYVVTPDIKATIVMRLQNHGIKVWCFGDSVLDLPMLKKSDRAFVLVCSEQTRSQRMEGELRSAIQNDNLQASQVIIPATAAPRLNTTLLPQVKLSNHAVIHTLVDEDYCATQQVMESTSTNATKILQTLMRDAVFQGPVLRKAHKDVGKFLALNYLSEIIGLEEFPILHVLGRPTTGYRLLHEQNTLIVALMRGGEPMAFGVNAVFPQAEFLHAFDVKNIQSIHLDDKFTIILVDSVVNTGDTVEEFVTHISKLHATVHIVIVTAVAQSRSIERLKQLQRSLKYNKLSLVALRLSDNKFKGQGVTDTGNRLFNTTNRV